MTVCHYFLQGRCRFGQNCRLEHSYANDDRNTRNPLNAQQLSTVVKKVAETVVLAEKGGQWPLSCFSPLKEGANIPGWEDYSPEEIRWKMYEARANGTLNQITQEINQLYSNAEKMRNLLKEPTIERAKIIADLLKGKTETSSISNPFTSLPSSSNIFGGSVQSRGSQNLFGTTARSGSHGNIFGVSATTTGNQGNIFGGATTTTGNQGNIFGGVVTTTGNQGNIFGGAVTTTGNQGNIFGGAVTTTGNQGNIFGGSSQSSGNIFGGGGGSFSNMNVFGGSVSSNAFSQSSLSNSQNTASGENRNIFASASVSSQNIFSNTSEGNNQTSSNAFLSPNMYGIFSSQSANPIFDSKKTENENQNQSFSFSSNQSENIFKTQNSFAKNDIFNTQLQTTKSALGSSFGSGQQISKEFDLSIYSKLEDLNEEEIKSFSSATFAFGKIPLKPPPLKYCK